MMMYNTKIKENIQTRCPKCGGKIYLNNDRHGWYVECLNCGYYKDLVSKVDGFPPTKNLSNLS